MVFDDARRIRPSVELLRELYDVHNGILVLRRRCKGYRARTAMLEVRDGVRVAPVKGVLVPSFWIVWRLAGGKWGAELSRVNGDLLDDRIANLYIPKGIAHGPFRRKKLQGPRAKRYVVVRNMGVCDG